jgi:hypothetical protein
MLRLRRILPVLMLAPALVLTPGLTPAQGAAYPTIVPLPVDFQPEGIATAGHTFYAGSLWDGDIYRGDLRSGEGEVFIDVSGRQAGGIKVDRRHGLLWVAGGFDGTAHVYDLATGADVATFTLAGLINDVVVTRHAAYFTNSFGPQIFKVPVASDGSLGAAETITVTGPAGEPNPGGFGLNGIVATANGKTLIVNHTDFGALYTIDPRTGVSRQITVTGGTLTPTTLDGLLRTGRSIWVVENFANRLVKVRLSRDWSTARVTATVTHPAFEVPSTVARHGKRLAVVNAKFNLGFPPPVGPGAPPGTPFEVVQLKP